MPSESVRKKIGQMLMVGFPSKTVDQQAVKALDDFYVGNYIYFSRNIESAAQTARLSGQMSQMVWDKLGICPIISTDQEGGIVSRLTEKAALIPGAAAVAAASDDLSEGQLAAVSQLGLNMGRILRACGINMDLAPDMDLNIEPKNPVIGCRSYGDIPDHAAAIAIAMMKGLKKGGVMTAIKHFPGHGNVQSDSHLGIPINDTDPDQLMKTEFETFRQGIEAGTDALMSAHVCYTKIDPDRPGTLSEKIQTELARNTFGFKGLQMTDCLEMDAIRKYYPNGEGAVLAVEAGIDILTVSHTYEALKDYALALYRAVDTGRISEERIDQSYQRIMDAKKRFGLDQAPAVDPAKAEEEAAGPDKIALAKGMMQKAITRLADSSEGAFDVSVPNFVVIAPDRLSATGAEDAGTISFTEAVCQRFGCLGAKMEMEPEGKDLDQILGYIDSAVKMGFKRFMIALYNARFKPGQIKVLQKVLSLTNARVMVVLLGAPYDLDLVKRLDPFGMSDVICSYEYTPLSVEAVLNALVSNDYPGKVPFHKLS